MSPKLRDEFACFSEGESSWIRGLWMGVERLSFRFIVLIKTVCGVFGSFERD